jgi:hypothetical protein
MGDAVSKGVVEPVTSCCSSRKTGLGGNNINQEQENRDGFSIFGGQGNMFFGNEEHKKKKPVGHLFISQAAFRGDETEVQIKLNEFAISTDEQDVDLNTPVHWAAVKGHTGILRLLLNHKFPPDIQNKDGENLTH